MPHPASLNKHRNDHQMAMVRKLAGRPGILMAQDENELADRIREARAMGEELQTHAPATHQLHDTLAEFIEGRIL